MGQVNVSVPSYLAKCRYYITRIYTIIYLKQNRTDNNGTILLV